MRYCANIYLLLLLVGGICSCSNPRPPTAAAGDVAVASIIADPKLGAQIGLVLNQAGINCVIVGSSRYDIRVPAGRKAEAVQLLKQDAQLHKYEIEFY
jgi:hypothetical protein